MRKQKGIRDILPKILSFPVIIIFLFNLLIPINASVTSGLETISYDEESYSPNLVHTFTFQPPKLRTKLVENTSYSMLTMPGCFIIGDVPGTPVYPTTPSKLLLPYRTVVSDIHVNSETIEVDTAELGIDLQETPLIPYQPPVRVGESPPGFYLDQGAYESPNPVPTSLYENIDIGYCRGYPILTLNLHPTKYSPGEGKLLYHAVMTVTIELEDTGYVDRFYRPGHQGDRDWISGLVANPEVLDTYRTSLLGAPLSYEGGLCDPWDNDGYGYDYVIITRSALSVFHGTTYSWNDLIQRKEADGLDATKVTVEDIVACSDYWHLDPLFNDTPALIREFCRDAYQDWGLQYVLVGGDQDGPDYVERRLMDFEDESDVESDLYWSNLHGTFNDDHDDEWGEKDDGSFDLYSELFIGSIPCDEGLDVSNWLTKSFFYADNYDPDYLDNAGFYGGDSYWPCECDDFIDFSAIKGSDNWFGPDPGVHGEYPAWLGYLWGFETWNSKNPDLAYNLSVKWTSEPPNPGWVGGSIEEAIAGFRAAINADQCTLIAGVAHGDEFKSLEVDHGDWAFHYHNTKPFFLHDYGCHVGDMDAADDGVLHTMLFHDDTELAFGCVYNTCWGYGPFDDTNTSSALQQKLFWDYFFDIDNNSGSPLNWQLGRAQAWSKDSMANTINWTYQYGLDSWRGIIMGCLLFGDPAQLIKPPVNPEHNIGVYSLDVPNHVKSNSPSTIRATIANVGQTDELSIVVRVLVNREEVNASVFSILESQTYRQVEFTWMAPPAGIYEVTLNVSIPGVTEYTYVDNEKSKMVKTGVLNYETEELFNTIQTAIDDIDTDHGHTLLVPRGTYYEQVEIDKQLSLTGENPDDTVIDGCRVGNVVNITADWVNLSGLTIRNSGNEEFLEPVKWWYAGIGIQSDFNTISDTIITGNYNGIGVYLDNPVLNTITDNVITDNSNFGIFLWHAMDTKIRENSITFNKYHNLGVLDSTHNTISDNLIKGSILGDGIWCANASLNTIASNTMQYNQFTGIYLDDSCIDNLIYHNNFLCNIFKNAHDSGENKWNTSYPSGGNYWDDHETTDWYTGPDQDEPTSDGIIDKPTGEMNPYMLWGSTNQDYYPLLCPYNLAAYWRFNEGIGQTAYDASPNENDGTLGATQAPDAWDPGWVSGIIGQALEFDGVEGQEDWVRVPDSESLSITDEITIEAWVKRYQIIGSNSAVVAKDPAYILEMHDKIRLWIRGSSGPWHTWEANFLPVNNVWYHIAGTYKTATSEWKIYINGTVNASGTEYLGGINQTTNPLTIGASFNVGYYGFFNGTIDEVRIYDRALNPEQIQAHYEDGRFRADPDLSHMTLTDTGVPGLATCPAGDGPSYQFIELLVHNQYGDPIPDIPSEYFIFNVTPTPGTQYASTPLCTIYSINPATDGEGRIQFNVIGATSIQGNLSIEVSVRGKPLNDLELLPCNSFDINVDGITNIVDLSIFGGDFGTPRRRSDFNWNGVVDLVDFSLFAIHFGH